MPRPLQNSIYAIRPQRTIIVLQIGSHAFEMIEHSPEKLAEKIARGYAGLIDYVLLDSSGGHGKPLDPEMAKSYLTALTSKNLELGLVVAGGLNPSTLHLVAPLVSQFPDLSIDAEKGLRDKEDRLDLELAQNFPQSALALFG